MFFGFLAKTKGNPKYIPVYIASRRWEFLTAPETLERFLGLLKFIIWIMLSMPFISLVIWSIVLIYQASVSDDKEYTTGIGALLIGFAVICVLASVLNISW
jgi:hypothetical protein